MIVKVIQAKSEDQRAECMTIRRKVFIDEQGYPPEVEVNEPQDPQCTHFLLLVDGRPAGTVRLNEKTYELSRFAILPEYRGQSLARPLVDAVHDRARSIGAKQVKAEVQADEREGKVDARGLYRKLGYVTRGKPYDRVGVLHQDMIFDLPV
ncbi:GCN5-like N-acetyltransferase [Papiliotrema laurentii]|uniref:GCN5-like N-acetyltransferase n=1 Tax=Papiliotrema laurentii TaxID=5418 RepID=A0AAD9CXW3_PAPLA|nr:GCN5-like N-acetyltransferase [Papiliotrema laurentii]